jgi:hypothetical protein
MSRGRPSLPRRSNRADFVAAVARAYLHIQDVAWLDECELDGATQAEFDHRVLFGRGLWHQKRLLRAANNLLARLPDVPDKNVRRIRATVRGLAAGQSLTAISRAEGKSREFWSRNVFHGLVAPLLAEELLDLDARQAVAERSDIR